MQMYNDSLLNLIKEKKLKGKTWKLSEDGSEILIDKTKWLDLKDIWYSICAPLGLRRIFCIGDNGIGKSYSVEEWITNDYIKKGINSVWCRNTQGEIKTCVPAFRKILLRHELNTEFEPTIEGVYSLEQQKKDEKYKRRPQRIDLVSAFVYLSSPDTSIPQGVQARIIIFDEIIPGNEKRFFTMHHPLSVIKKLISRVVRPLEENVNIPIIFLSNPHRLDCDILSAFKIDLNWERLYNGLDQIEIIGKSLLIAIPRQFNIEQNRGTLQLFDDICDKPENYEYPHPGLKRIFCNRPEEFCKPAFNLTLGGKDEEFTIYFTNSSTCYIEKMSKENNDLENYCFQEEEKNYHNIYIASIDSMLRICEQLEICHLNDDKVYYDSIYTQTRFNIWFGMLNFLKRSQ